MADRYDAMTTAQLEAEAAGREPPVDLTGLTRNADRATKLRLDDQDRTAVIDATEVAAVDEFSEPEPTGDVEPEPIAAPEVTDELRPTTPYLNDEDLAARLANAYVDPPQA